jgi:2-polyprenyl-3-methyl-5-hydroxy-6-metoxy-1,4-benzoquinol methylase
MHGQRRKGEGLTVAPEIIKEQGIPVGNVYDKYGTRNPLARYLVGEFLANVLDLARQTDARSVHEIGCGEGHLTQLIADTISAQVKGSDFSSAMIERATAENRRPNVSFIQRDIYALGPEDSAELIVCCEVLEHLERPEDALSVLSGITSGHVILSVPREPLWRVMNMARGKYLRDRGNTPGHLQHWSRAAFLRLLKQHFQVVAVRSPVPWTIALCRKGRSQPG